MKYLFLIVVAVSIPYSKCFNQPNQRLDPRLNFFDVDLLHHAAEGRRGNVMVSPASIKSVLAMLLQGSMGQTAIEIQRALRLPADKQDALNQIYLFLNALQSNSTTTALQHANGVFVSKSLKLKTSFDDIVRRDFTSEVTSLDFHDSKSAALAINGWVSQKTHGFIPFVVEPDQISTSTHIVLANALFFKSSWHNAFDPKLTRAECFYRDNVCTNVAMMGLEAELNYAYVDELRAHAVELPYDGKRYSMILLVPIQKDGFEDLIRDLPYVGLNHITRVMKPTESVTLTMPKFTINYNENIVPILKKAQISTIFSPQANLTGMFEGVSSAVSSFYHKVFMSVDETGTVAAAASASAVVPLMFNGVDVRVDKPFVFYIRDNSMGIVLFEGKIEEPTPVDGPIGEPTVDMRNGPVLNSPLPTPIVKTKSNSFINGVKKIFG